MRTFSDLTVLFRAAACIAAIMGGRRPESILWEGRP